MHQLTSRSISGKICLVPQRTRPASFSRSSLKPKALFGWGKKSEEEEWAQMDKEEQYRVQQELLQARRSGSALKDASSRRQKVQENLRAKKQERQSERDALAEGKMPETLKKWKPYSDETNKNANSGIVVPLLPFGIRKYDEGERFDLRSPYADDGWVDPEETDMWSGLKKLGSKVLNLTGKEPESQQGKPIIWASQYDKYVREKGQKGDQQKDKK